MKLTLFMLGGAELALVGYMGYRFGPEAFTLTAIMGLLSSITTMVALVVYMRENNP